MMKIRSALAPIACYLYNMLWVFVVYMLCRWVFFWQNASHFPQVDSAHFFDLCVGGLAFDTSAILYTNALFTLLFLFPLHWKETPAMHRFLRWLFVGVNTFCVAMNMVDTVYFPFAQRRTTMSVFTEFGNENNLLGIFGIEAVKHWYLVLFTVLVGWALYRLYRQPSLRIVEQKKTYYAVYTLAFLAVIPLTVGGMRGGLRSALRPITISNANQYTNTPTETAIVLNTPFSMIRTLGKKPYIVPQYFTDDAQMTAYYTPLHPAPADSVAFRKKNVVVLILESFGKEYFGVFNRDLDGGKYRGYTPFLDSLVQESLTFQYSFANGQKSIDGMPSALSSIPRFGEPFISTPASLNQLSSVAGELRKEGYYTAFFHGAYNGSMGFLAYARSAGFQDYFGRTEYNNDDDFDGHWGIWDEEFLQFYAQEMTQMKQPFCTALFTVSSHHPFKVPERYEGKFPKGEMEIHQTIGYSDMALRRFFETASRQDWFSNTLFIITADHVNMSNHDVYKTSAGLFAVPVIFYSPQGDLKGVRDGISQQIDIMPTALGYLGYPRPYVAFGQDLLHTEDAETFAVNYYNGIYQYFKGDYLLQFDGEKVIGIYAFKTDRLLQHNLLETVHLPAEEQTLKSIIQQYMFRMTRDQLVVSDEK